MQGFSQKGPSHPLDIYFLKKKKKKTRKIHLISYNFMGKHAFRMASLECLAKSLLPSSKGSRFMACVLLAEAIQCTYDRKKGSYCIF